MKGWYPARAAFAAALWVIASGLIAVGCGSSGSVNEPGSGSLGYVPGAPNFYAALLPVDSSGATSVEVHVGVPAASLVFARRGAGYEAQYDLLVRALDDEDRLIREQITSHTARTADFASTRRFIPFRHDVRIDLPPGRYKMQVVVVDGASGHQAARTMALRLPSAREPHLADPVFTIRTADGKREPVLTSFVSDAADSLRAAIHLRLPDAVQPVVELDLLRVARDTTMPTPPYWVTPDPASIVYRGIGGVPADSVFSHARMAENQETMALEVDLPRIERGLYRLDVSARDEASDGNGIRRSRYFVVTSDDFPRVETLDQMIEALGYLAYEREVRQMQEAPTEVEKKRRFDAFWGSLVRERSVAMNLIETYYARIEEANLLYSSFKEGWKTDRGMIYVLLGAPALINSYADSEVWRYSHNDDALYTFVFDRVRIPDTDGVYENYILRRRPYYEHIWLQVLDRWRSGVVL